MTTARRSLAAHADQPVETDEVGDNVASWRDAPERNPTPSGDSVRLENLAYGDRRQSLLTAFRRVRAATIEMCRPLEPEAFRVQPMEDVSPPWWNLGHTSWFFARNVLQPFGGETHAKDADFDFVLNSYYAALGPRLARAHRGSMTRPATDEVFAYRSSVDERMDRLIESIDGDQWEDFERVVTIGLNHEQQHQELFYTEIKYILWQDPPRLRRAYRPAESVDRSPPRPRGPDKLQFVPFDGGLFQFGGLEPGFCWDNELPVYRQFLEPFALADRLITNGEFREFIDDGGYQQQLLWLDNGWNCAERGAWEAPLYWERDGHEWQQWTLAGLVPLDLAEPVSHVSFYEIDAFARWKSATWSDDRGVVLPDERQWEHAARAAAPEHEPGGFLDGGRLQPNRDSGGRRLRQMFGQVWQWTRSYYEPYPGYKPFPGNLAEYNSKFMDNQRVLRGGSCVTPRDHFHISYRNFWAAPTRFQFTGIRLAREL
jgi:ergothioneine biosynthesis protein EgtB